MNLGSADKEVHRLAVGCFYILTDLAAVCFPGTDSAHPSPFVLVDRTPKGLMEPGDRMYFPQTTSWDVWHRVVVPVLQDPANQVITRDNRSLRNEINLAWVQSGEYGRVISQIEASLLRGLRAEGYLPPDPAEASQVVLSPEYPEATPPAPPGDPDFPNPDGNVVWPEGHPRRTYPTVR